MGRFAFACIVARTRAAVRSAPDIGESDARSAAWYRVNEPDALALVYVELTPPPAAILDVDVADPRLEPLLMAGPLHHGS